MLESVINKMNELARLGRQKIALISLQRHIEKNFLELGGRVYHLAVEEGKAAILDDARVNELLNTLRKLENDLREKKREMQSAPAASP